MIDAVKHKEAGRRAENVVRDLGVTDQTLYNRRSHFSGMRASQAWLLREDRTATMKPGFTDYAWQRNIGRSTASGTAPAPPECPLNFR